MYRWDCPDQDNRGLVTSGPYTWQGAVVPSHRALGNPRALLHHEGPLLESRTVLFYCVLDSLPRTHQELCWHFQTYAQMTAPTWVGARNQLHFIQCLAPTADPGVQDGS